MRNSGFFLVQAAFMEAEYPLQSTLLTPIDVKKHKNT